VMIKNGNNIYHITYAEYVIINIMIE